jgi:hypothetical protein
MVERFTSPCAVFYTYVIGLRPDTYEFHIAPDAFAGVFPTNDGEACVWLIRPTPLLEPIRTAAPGVPPLRRQLETAGADLGRRVRAGRITAGFAGTANLPNYRRQAHGPNGRSSATPDTTGTRSPVTASPTRSGTRNYWRPRSTGVSVTRRASRPR